MTTAFLSDADPALILVKSYPRGSFVEARIQALPIKRMMLTGSSLMTTLQAKAASTVYGQIFSGDITCPWLYHEEYCLGDVILSAYTV